MRYQRANGQDLDVASTAQKNAQKDKPPARFRDRDEIKKMRKRAEDFREAEVERMKRPATPEEVARRNREKMRKAGQ